MEKYNDIEINNNLDTPNPTTNNFSLIKTLKISTKINLAFIGIIVLLIIILLFNVVMINNISKIKEDLVTAYNCLNDVKELEKAIHDEKLIQETVLTSYKVTNSSALYTQASNRFNIALKKVKQNSMLLSQADNSLVETLEKQHKDYSDIFFNTTLKINEKLANPKTVSIAEQQKISTTNVINKFSSNFNSEINLLVNSIQVKMARYNEMIDNQFVYMVTYFALAIIISIIFTMVFSRLLSSSISRHISKLNSSAKELGEGNLQFDIDIESNDELGFLGRTFTETVNKLRLIISNISSSSQTIFTASDQILTYNTQAANNIKKTSKLMTSVSKGTEKQQENIQKIYINSNDISKIVVQIQESTDILQQYINEASSIGFVSLKSVQETINQMSQINSEINHTSDLIKNLQAKSKNIEGIADIISSVAAQTNLLSLNASIEAARAGEQGKGFTVVAEEIRKLANQVGDSSKNILEITKDINSEVNIIFESMSKNTVESKKGIDLVSKTGEAFNTINSSIVEQLDKITFLSQNIDNLSESFSLINDSIREIVDFSESISFSTQNAFSTIFEEYSASQELSSSSAAKLTKVAKELQDLVSVFKV